MTRHDPTPLALDPAVEMGDHLSSGVARQLREAAAAEAGSRAAGVEEHVWTREELEARHAALVAAFGRRPADPGPPENL